MGEALEVVGVGVSLTEEWKGEDDESWEGFQFWNGLWDPYENQLWL